MFRWYLVFNEIIVFIIVGLLLMVFGVMLYNYFSNKEVKEKVKEGNFLFIDLILIVNVKD